MSSATPVEKDIVIIIDTSGSMSATHNGLSLMQIAHQAAISVLQTLNPNDRVCIENMPLSKSVLSKLLFVCIEFVNFMLKIIFSTCGLG